MIFYLRLNLRMSFTKALIWLKWNETTKIIFYKINSCSIYTNKSSSKCDAVPSVLENYVPLHLLSLCLSKSFLSYLHYEAIPSFIFSLSLPMLHFPSIIPVVTRFSISSLLITWLKTFACCLPILLIRNHINYAV